MPISFQEDENDGGGRDMGRSEPKLSYAAATVVRLFYLSFLKIGSSAGGSLPYEMPDLRLVTWHIYTGEGA